MQTRVENGFVIDENNNRVSISLFGSEEKAIEALKLNKGCSGCSDCFDCFHCLDCSGCSSCSNCFRCSGCSDCSHCSDCSGCSGCSSCSNCFRCLDCSDCSGCLDCSDCFFIKNAAPVGRVNSPKEIPIIENIHQKVFEAASKPCALDMRSWHSCETTHCRAGWVVHLAGAAGYKLEAKTSALFAAQQIYKVSGYEISPCRFFESNEQALADMKRLAEEEQIAKVS